MKKTVMIAIVLCMLMGLVSSAAAATDEEILFRGIPWDLPVDKYITDLMGTFDVVPFAKQIPPLETEGVSLPYFDGTVSLDRLVEVPSLYFYAFFNDGQYVAGHEVGSVFGYALPEVKNGHVGTAERDYRFASLEYVLKSGTHEEMAAIYEDLRQKLSDMYGESGPANIADGSAVMADRWEGANDTCAVLCLYNLERDGEMLANIKLVYCYDSLADWVAKINNPSSTIDKSSTDGL